MFDFLKKIFGKEKEEKDDFSEEVALDNLSSWFDSKSKELFGTMEDNLQAKFDRFSQLLEQLKQASENLGLATINEKDQNVDPKIRNVVMGHRQNYIRLLKNTLLSLEVPSDAEPKHALEFCDTVSGMLEQIAKNSAKSYYAVQHLFSGNTEEISDILREIDELIKETREEIRNKRVHDIKEIKKKIKGLESEYEEKKELQKELSEEKKKYEDTINTKDNAEQKIKSIKESDDFAELKREQDTLQDVENGISKAKRNIIEMIAPLEPALRKYARVASEKEDIVQGYADNPVRMLLQDKQLEIMDILAKMRDQISKGNLDFKDKKQEKMLEKIDAVKKEDVSSIVGEYTVYLNRKNELLNKVSASSLLSERRKLSQKIESSEREIESMKGNLERLEKAVEEIDLDKKVEDLEKQIKEVIGIKADIFISSS